MCRGCLGLTQHVVVARELTKLHEEFLRGAVAEVLEKVNARGEMVLILPVVAREEVAELGVAEAVAKLMKGGLSEKEALKGGGEGAGAGEE